MEVYDDFGTVVVVNRTRGRVVHALPPDGTGSVWTTVRENESNVANDLAGTMDETGETNVFSPPRVLSRRIRRNRTDSDRFVYELIDLCTHDKNEFRERVTKRNGERTRARLG